MKGNGSDTPGHDEFDMAARQRDENENENENEKRILHALLNSCMSMSGESSPLGVSAFVQNPKHAWERSSLRSEARTNWQNVGM